MQVYVRPGTFFVNRMPYSEVCMHMQIAGKDMVCQIVGERPCVQLYAMPEVNPDRKPFSFPILTGEAGVFEDGHGFYVHKDLPYKLR